MIKRIEIHNLKSIKHIQMKCSALNLCIGTNSSGKSTIHQALLFAAQNTSDICGLNGKLISLGTFRECKCGYSAEKNISVRIDGENDCSLTLRLAQGTKPDQLALRSMYCDGDKELLDDEEKTMKEYFKKQLSYENRKVQYLSCHRVGTENIYKKNMTMEDVLGINGEYAISYLNQHKTDPIDESLRKNKVDFTLLGQVNYWLKLITSAEIKTEEILGADMIKASYNMNDIIDIRPMNIGSGISYLISILIMCLASTEDSIMIIENPEIHLHPSAQAKLCEFLYFIAQKGRQIFVESHSDHIFNGFRAGIATNTMDSKLLNIQFVSLGDDHTTHTMEVKIGKYGRVENQCEDLFDQFDIDLNKMLGL